MNITVNNVNIFYEVYGEGQPIILLHGNGSSHKTFDVLIDRLKEEYKVYAIDSRCHGQSENTEKISYNLMAEDTIEFIKKLNIEKPVICGSSDGGIIGIIIAIKEPKLVSRVFACGANITPDATTKRDVIHMKLQYFFTRNKLVKMMLDEPNITAQELQRIEVPVHVIAGEKDVIRQEHTELIAKSIKNSTLKILQGETHSSYISHSDKMYDIMKEYM